MKYIFILLVTMVHLLVAVPGENAIHAMGASLGELPEMVVTAERFEVEDESWVGMLDTVVVTAPRVRIVTGSTADKNPAGQNLLFTGLIFLGSLSLSSLSWFTYRHYLRQRRRLQNCPC